MYHLPKTESPSEEGLIFLSSFAKKQAGAVIIFMTAPLLFCGIPSIFHAKK